MGSVKVASQPSSNESEGCDGTHHTGCLFTIFLFTILRHLHRCDLYFIDLCIYI